MSRKGKYWKGKYNKRKRIVVEFELDEFEFLLNKKGDKTWAQFILELTGYKKGKENSGVTVENDGCSEQ